jgi:hypothetical protein
MGQSANVFHSSDESKETLNKRVTLLPEQVDYARLKKNHLLSYLKSELSARFKILVRYWLQGSYKNHTLIRPVGKGEEFDIDAGVYLLFNAEKKGVQADYAKSILREVLVDYCSINEEAHLKDPKPNCERISYPEYFHIDLPLYYLDEDTGDCRLATENSGWIDSDPKSFQDWFDYKVSELSDLQKSRLRRIIKYFKTWVALKGVTLPSIAITTYVTDQYHDFEGDDDTFAQNSANLANHLRRGEGIKSPINGVDLVGGNDEEKSNLQKELVCLLQSLREVNVSASASEAHPYWTAILEHIYPPVAEIGDQSTGSNLPARTLPPMIKVRKEDKNGKFVEDSTAESIIGYIDEKLKFSITNIDSYPLNSIVKWMVRNKDKDASLVNDLGHLKVIGISDVCDEHCGYRGTHYMECVIESNGIVQGAKSIKVKLNGMSRPLRNPPRNKYGPRR